MTDDALNSQSLGFVENLYENYLQNKDSVPRDWRDYFSKLTPSRANRIGPSFKPASIFNPPADGVTNGHGPTAAQREAADFHLEALQERVDQLIRNYRVRGHIVAQVDPLGMPRPQPPELDYKFFGLTDADLDRPFSCEEIPGPDKTTLRQILEKLHNTYCRSVGVQFMHIDDLVVRQWLQSRMEASENRANLTRREQLRILTRLTDATIFEEFIQKKFIGAKSFSLEGGESLIPLLDMMIENAGASGIEQIVMGMAHRGRLNVLANIMGKNARQIFREFEDKDPSLHMGSGGDVKYHLGYSSDWSCAAGRKIHLSLCFNPSHLEYVNTVVLGRVRAKQDRTGDTDRLRGLAILIHGDAAFAGEGICQETLNLSELHGYTVGGTVHVIINNQIGFTTNPGEARSCTYATDIAKMLQTPIFHVNGEDPEAVAQVVKLSMEFRRTFQRDVVIDMYCYRRRGHNESDEPAFTQPLLYKAIEARKSVREGYLEHLLALGQLTREDADSVAIVRREHLEMELSVARTRSSTMVTTELEGVWRAYKGGLEKDVPDVPTGAPKETLAKLLKDVTVVPEGFRPHPKLVKVLETRALAAEGKKPLDWAMGESLAFATIATQGLRVRLSGQDVGRGTFSHRHAVLHDFENGTPYCSLNNLSPNQAPVEIVNSPLSESGVLGFEYGYSLDWPDGLILWEAQFGDFWNVAQPIVDQFIISAEEKWKRLSGLVLLLPHGLEGQGPEHSSARLERFLLNAAKENIQVAVPTNPAQYFHLLRRQALRPWRKPLVVMTPKSLLRHPQAVSQLDELERGTFQRVIPDSSENKSAISRVIFCCGKIYYELLAERDEKKRSDVDIVRIEQLYPIPYEQIKAVLANYPENVPVIWTQEEPENMGAWRFMRFSLGAKTLGRRELLCSTRAASASPATGSPGIHKKEQREVIEKAFGDLKNLQ